MNLKELYQEIILDHGKNPRNLGKFDNFNKDAKGHNPLCGDKVHLFLKLDENKKVNDISFEGEGCAISMASASIMTDLMKGKSEKDAKEIIEKFLDMIKEKDDIDTKLLEEDEKTKLMSSRWSKKLSYESKVCYTFMACIIISFGGFSKRGNNRVIYGIKRKSN